MSDLSQQESQTQEQQASQDLEGINRERLFWGICLALLPTAFSFVLVSNILNQLKAEFILTNYEVGLIGGAALWGMCVSLFLMGPFLEKFGLKNGAAAAFGGHLLGVTLFLAAYPFAGNPGAFWVLFMGAIGMGVGNGMIEVVGNPLTTSLYPERKTTKLNHFHAFYPGGMVAGGVLGWLMVQIGGLGPVNIGHWTWQMAVVYIPIFAYGALLLPEEFPETERERAGIPIREMFRYTLTHPLFWLLVVLKIGTLGMEMGSMRWIPEVLQAAGLHGILVLAWISGIMMVLRVFASPFVETLSPTGMLLGASVLTGTGLLMFALLEPTMMAAMTSATVFAVGVAFFFPTMVGLLSERLPRTGSLGIVLLIGFGFLSGGAAAPIMGQIADQYLPEALPEEETVSILEQVEERFPGYVEQANDAAGNPEKLASLGFRSSEVQSVLDQAQTALDRYSEQGELEGNLVGNALRALYELDIDQEEELSQRAHDILRPAENYGGRRSFFWLVPVAGILAIVFAVMFVQDQRRGGYKAVVGGSEDGV